jgi:hypothetical protein
MGKLARELSRHEQCPDEDNFLSTIFCLVLAIELTTRAATGLRRKPRFAEVP